MPQKLKPVPLLARNSHSVLLSRMQWLRFRCLHQSGGWKSVTDIPRERRSPAKYLHPNLVYAVIIRDLQDRDLQQFFSFFMGVGGVFRDRVFLCSGCLGAMFVDQVSLLLTGIHMPLTPEHWD